jgi:hypothetical protein
MKAAEVVERCCRKSTGHQIWVGEGAGVRAPRLLCDVHEPDH